MCTFFDGMVFTLSNILAFSEAAFQPTRKNYGGFQPATSRDTWTMKSSSFYTKIQLPFLAAMCRSCRLESPAPSYRRYCRYFLAEQRLNAEDLDSLRLDGTFLFVGHRRTAGRNGGIRMLSRTPPPQTIQKRNDYTLVDLKLRVSLEADGSIYIASFPD